MFSCASTAYYQQATAGKIGCVPDDIQITELGSDVWSATCKGKKFICSMTVINRHYETDFTCTPEMK